MTAADLRGRLSRLREDGSMARDGGRLEVMAAEREVSRYLQGKNPPSAFAANRLGQIMVRERASHEDVAAGFVADPEGFELACRNPLQRIRFRLGRALDRAFGG